MSNIWTLFLEFGLDVSAFTYCDWNTSNITSFIYLPWKMRRHTMKSLQLHVCSLSHVRTFIFTSITMLAIRLYISALTLLFLFLVIINRALGKLEVIVIACALIYLILDTRDELQIRKLELRCLRDLEQRISALLR